LTAIYLLLWLFNIYCLIVFAATCLQDISGLRYFSVFFKVFSVFLSNFSFEASKQASKAKQRSKKAKKDRSKDSKKQGSKEARKEASQPASKGGQPASQPASMQAREGEGQPAASLPACWPARREHNSTRNKHLKTYMRY